MKRLVVIIAAIFVSLPMVMAQDIASSQLGESAKRKSIMQYNLSFGGSYAFDLHDNGQFRFMLGGLILPIDPDNPNPIIDEQQEYMYGVGPSIEFDALAWINDYLLVGGEFTTAYYFPKAETHDMWLLCGLSAKVKGYMPIKSDRVKPFVSLAAGWTIDFVSFGGPYLGCNIGVDIDRFVMSIGYRGFSSEWIRKDLDKTHIVSTLHLQLGVRFGK